MVFSLLTALTAESVETTDGLRNLLGGDSDEELRAEFSGESAGEPAAKI